MSVTYTYLKTEIENRLHGRELVDLTLPHAEPRKDGVAIFGACITRNSAGTYNAHSLSVDPAGTVSLFWGHYDMTLEAAQSIMFEKAGGAA